MSLTPTCIGLYIELFFLGRASALVQHCAVQAEPLSGDLRCNNSPSMLIIYSLGLYQQRFTWSMLTPSTRMRRVESARCGEWMSPTLYKWASPGFNV